MNKSDSGGFSVVEVLIILVVVILIGGAGFYVYKANTDKNSSNAENSKIAAKEELIEPERDPYEGWRTYKNEAYNYEFKYPSTLLVESTEDYGANGTPATSSSAGVQIAGDDIFFSFSVEQNVQLDQAYIHSEFGLTNPADITIEPVTHSGIPGYKVTSAPSVGAVSHFYYLQKDGETTLYELTVLKTPDTSNKIFESLRIK